MKLIVAVNNKGYIGHNGKIPWECKEDLKHFFKLTKNGTVIMGRSTWESLPVRPLPNRINVIVSSTLTQEDVDGGDDTIEAVVAESIETVVLVESLHPEDNTWVIGGKTIYDQMAEHCTEIHISHINNDSEGDTKWEVPADFSGKVFHYNFEEDGRSNQDTTETKEIDPS